VQTSIIESFPGSFLLSIVGKLRPCKQWQQFVKRWDNDVGGQWSFVSDTKNAIDTTMPQTAAWQLGVWILASAGSLILCRIRPQDGSLTVQRETNTTLEGEDIRGPVR